MRYEFYRNIKYAIKDYELVRKSHIIDKNTEQLNITQYYIQKKTINNDMNRFNQIEQWLLSTELTNKQINLVEEFTQLLYKYIESKYKENLSIRFNQTAPLLNKILF